MGHIACMRGVKYTHIIHSGKKAYSEKNADEPRHRWEAIL
jgi:hypothetical protein